MGYTCGSHSLDRQWDKKINTRSPAGHKFVRKNQVRLGMRY